MSDPEFLQARFTETRPESIKVGDVFVYRREFKEEPGYFINNFGWKLESLPVGAIIKTQGFVITIGLNFPESVGEIFHENGHTYFRDQSIADKYLKTGKYTGTPSKFFDHDRVEILTLENK